MNYKYIGKTEKFILGKLTRPGDIVEISGGNINTDLFEKCTQKKEKEVVYEDKEIVWKEKEPKLKKNKLKEAENGFNFK